jgi:hypothetical protein
MFVAALKDDWRMRSKHTLNPSTGTENKSYTNFRLAEGLAFNNIEDSNPLSSN